MPEVVVLHRKACVGKEGEERGTKSIASKWHSVEDGLDFLINTAVDRMLETLRLNLDLDPLELIRKTVCDAGDAGRLRCPLLQHQNS